MTNHLLNQLHQANARRREKMAELDAAERDVEEAVKKLRRTKEAKALVSARRIRKMIQEQTERVRLEVDAIIDEIDSGMSGLPLYDLAKNGALAESR